MSLVHVSQVSLITLDKVQPLHVAAAKFHCFSSGGPSADVANVTPKADGDGGPLKQCLTLCM